MSRPPTASTSAPLSWSFTTAGRPAACEGDGPAADQRTPPPCSASTKAQGDPARPGAGVEVGVEFTPKKVGSVVALRYFQVSGRAAPRSMTALVRQRRSSWPARRSLARAPSRRRPVGARSCSTTRSPCSAGQTYVASYYLPAAEAARTRGFYKKKLDVGTAARQAGPTTVATCSRRRAGSPDASTAAPTSTPTCGSTTEGLAPPGASPRSAYARIQACIAIAAAARGVDRAGRAELRDRERAVADLAGRSRRGPGPS